MKKITYTLAAIFASAFALTSCTKEMTDSSKDIESQGIPFEICASVSQTRTTTDNSWNTTWVAKDAINLFHAKAGTTTYVSDGQFTVENTESGKFKGNLAGTLDADSYDWYAFYPYSSYNKTPAGDAQSNFGYTTIGGTSQTQTGNNSQAHLCGKPCPLYGVVKSVSKSSSPTISMQQLVSVIEVNVTNNSGEDLTVSSVSFTGTEDIVGTFYINFTGTPVYTIKDASSVSETASLTVSEGAAIANGASAKFYLAIKPFTASSGSNLKLSVNGYEKTKELTSDVTFAAGKIKTLNFDFDKNNCVVLPWSIDGTQGSSAWKNTVGLSQSGLGADYTAHSPYCSRMDDTGDFVQIKYDSPAKAITFAVKMIGGKTTSYMSLQGSDEDNSFTEIEKFTISGSQNNILTFTSANEINSSYRYLRLVFTKGANIGLGKVAITKNSTDPAIDADNISDVSARGESAGVLKYTIQNPVDGVSISATCDGTVVTDVLEYEGSFLYDVASNTTTSAREGSITLTYGDITKVVTVSQLAPVFKVSRTEVELDAEAGSSSTITLTSDFGWNSKASTDAGFTSTPTTCEWNAEKPYTDGKTTVTIKASAVNDSEEGTKALGTLTFTNTETAQTLVVSVSQKSSYVASSTGTEVTFDLGYTVTDSKNKDWSITQDGVTISWGLGTNTNNNAPSPNKEGSVRMYVNNSITIQAPEGKSINKIVFTPTSASYDAKKLQYNGKALNSNEWSLPTPSTSITLSASANARFKKIVVTYN